MKNKIFMTIAAAAIASAMVAAGFSGGNIVGTAYAATETMADEDSSISVSSKNDNGKTKAEVTSEKTSGGYKVTKRQNGSRDLSYAYNASPKTKKVASEDTVAASSTTVKAGVSANGNSSGNGEAGISDLSAAEEKPVESSSSTSSNDAASTSSADPSSDSSATSAVNTEAAEPVQQTPKAVKQVIKFNATYDADIDFDAICQRYEPEAHGKYLTRIITRTMPADESVGELSDLDTAVSVTNVIR